MISSSALNLLGVLASIFVIVGMFLGDIKTTLVVLVAVIMIDIG